MERQRGSLRTALVLGALAVAMGAFSCGTRQGPDSVDGLPAGWTARKRTVEVHAPQGVEEREITYYPSPTGMEFVLIPAGEFMMGRDEESPQRRVRITRPFYMGAHEVTQRQYETLMGTSPSLFKDGPHRPVERVSWHAAEAFCRRLGARTGATVRLPTEAEWEYACRAGMGTSFYRGNLSPMYHVSHDDEDEGGQHEEGRKGFYRGETTAVGSFPANPFGLYDMRGNVWEWCQDWYGDDYYKDHPAVDPQGPETGVFRTLRGGRWFGNEIACRAALPTWTRPLKAPYGLIGFRVVMLPRSP